MNNRQKPPRSTRGTTKGKSRRTRAKPRQQRRDGRTPRTKRQWLAASRDEQQQRTLVVHAIAKMRAEGLSLPKSAQAVGVHSSAIKRYARAALRRDKRGRWRATKRDSLLRVLNVPGERGTREVAIRDSRTASAIGSYADAVRKYIRTGDSSALEPFRTLRLHDASGRRIVLVTDPPTLDRLGHAGVLSYESLYARVGP